MNPSPSCNLFGNEIKRWLSGDTSANLATMFYTDDTNDSRWDFGHSSPDYYVRKDEYDTFRIALDNININTENFFDLGVGGTESVLGKSIPLAKRIGARAYYSFDLSNTFAKNAADIAARHGFSSNSFICDIFEDLPFFAASNLISLLGLTIGNLPSFRDEVQLRKRLEAILSQFYRACASMKSTGDDIPSRSAKSFLLVSYDANRDISASKSCYENPEFEELVRSTVARGIGNTEMFSYEIIVESSHHYDSIEVGLIAKGDFNVKFDNFNFYIEDGTFFPVINSYRFSSNFIEAIAREAGWSTSTVWSATGRVHYHLFST